MSVVLGEVNGDDCPKCGHSLNIEGEFFEGSEVECKNCGAISVISEIEATYEVYMDLIEDPEEEEDEDEENDEEE